MCLNTVIFLQVKSMFKSPIFVCSSLCQNCVELADIMSANQKKFQNVIVLNIGIDSVTKKRPRAYYDLQNILEWKIKSVPTIITENAERILSGVEAFEWVKKQTQDKFMSYTATDVYSKLGDSSCVIDNNGADKEFLARVGGDKKDGHINNNFERMAQERQAEVKETNVPQRPLSPPITQF